ncbi:imidazoleglycerol-phosphate dehydratase HisB [Parvularcula dongshanensis]|uniref:Imidazoleglycerol-phosphate dehydratase n=1 Tax=Parvularcula dongshanensis TaxID=1173995 RepID=A0A840I7N2_9PROT|nr:imidazoleglycerol-phosphate dehydratase HisB [Parvularcula dongshanensis]MBB4659970.1 imidazoleglycerol-phosphate dehydratase [Parvularcula dongshanensis]
MPLDTAPAPRSAERSRKTKETDITVRLDLDGTGRADVATGIGFLDHMLEGFAKHALFDLYVRCDGDLHIDGHHTTEDVGIVMGLALKKALGDMGGITRFGHAYVPMDETLSRASVDVSGRPYLIWKVEFTRDKIGEMDTELFREWFHAFATNAGLTCHVECLYGLNNHHVVESAFKALARACKIAVTPEPRLGGAPASTKGSLGS